MRETHVAVAGEVFLEAVQSQHALSAQSRGVDEGPVRRLPHLLPRLLLLRPGGILNA